MSAKEDFLRIKTKEEYLRLCPSLGKISPDKETVKHMRELFGKASNCEDELYKSKPGSKNRFIGN